MSVRLASAASALLVCILIASSHADPGTLELGERELKTTNSLATLVPSRCRSSPRCILQRGQCRQAQPNQKVCPPGHIANSRLCKGKKCACCIPVTPKPCVQSRSCSRKGGKCKSREECPKTFQWVPKLCRGIFGTSSCGCCIPKKTMRPTIPKPCLQTKLCFNKGGKCKLRSECPRSYQFLPKECARMIFPKKEISPKKDAAVAVAFPHTIGPVPITPACGCCVPPTRPPTLPKPCVQTASCAKGKKGKCTKRDSCPKTHIWNSWLCKKTPFGNQSRDCGCCYPRKTRSPTIPRPCKRTKYCDRVNGKCMRADECKRLHASQPNFNWKYEPKLCARGNSRDCGCCYREKTLPPSTIPEPCKPTRTCIHNGGKCMKAAECKRLDASQPNLKWRFDYKLCLKDSADRDCGCCYPEKTQPPSTITKPCEPTDECHHHGGKCMKAEQCKQYGVGWKFEPHFCHQNDDTQECGCCFRERTEPPSTITKPCEPTDECHHHGGKCMKAEQCKQYGAGWKFEPHFCHQNDDTQECGCCFREKTEPPSTITKPCEQTSKCEERNGRCMSKYECEGFGAGVSGWHFDQELCHSDPDLPMRDCGCCWKDRTPPPSVSKPCQPTDKCKANNGRCVSKQVCLSRVGPVPMEWVPEMCASDNTDDSCGCCKAKVHLVQNVHT